MKVFISWSGDLSRELGDAFRTWLPGVLQAVRPYFTPSDIEKGSRWSKDIAKELDDSSIGVFCLTKENLQKPWIMFEAGALSKNLDTSRVCPILFNVDNSDLQGPLVQFQGTQFSKAEIRKLIKAINNLCGEGKLDETVLTNVFDMWWPKLEENVNKILSNHKEKGESKEVRQDREILEEILALTRLTAKTSRRESKNINPNAIRDIFNVYLNLFESTRTSSKHESLMEHLQALSAPLEYIVANCDLPQTRKEEMLERLSCLDFSILSLPFDPNDDIPF